MKKTLCQTGFSLLEVSVALVIISVITGGLVVLASNLSYSIKERQLLDGHHRLVTALMAEASQIYSGTAENYPPEKVNNYLVKSNLVTKPYFIETSNGNTKLYLFSKKYEVDIWIHTGLIAGVSEGRMLILRYQHIPSNLNQKLYRNELALDCVESNGIFSGDQKKRFTHLYQIVLDQYNGNPTLTPYCDDPGPNRNTSEDTSYTDFKYLLPNN